MKKKKKKKKKQEQRKIVKNNECESHNLNKQINQANMKNTQSQIHALIKQRSCSGEAKNRRNKNTIKLLVSVKFYQKNKKKTKNF